MQNIQYIQSIQSIQNIQINSKLFYCELAIMEFSFFIKRPVVSFFSNSRNLEQPGLMIETLEYIR